MTDKSNDRTVDGYQDELSDVVNDGSGCAELWTTLSGMRDGASGDTRSTSDRRGFMSRVAMTLGIVPIGATATTSASSSDGSRMGTADSNNRGEIQPEVEELQGDRRRPLEKEALESEKVQFVADRIGTQGKVASAFRYSLQSGTTGYGVTIGVDAAAEEPIISYYESDAFADGTAVVGGKPAGDGYLVVDADTKQVFHVHGTPQLNEAVKMLPRNEAYSEFRQQLAEGTVQENEAIMVQGFEDGETRTDILLPIAHNNNNNIDRLVVSGSGTPTDASIDRYSVASSSDVNGPVQNQVAPCGPICGVLTVAGAGACLGVCVSNPITAPYASYCGQLCAAATIGTCIPTCNDIL